MPIQWPPAFLPRPAPGHRYSAFRAWVYLLRASHVSGILRHVTLCQGTRGSWWPRSQRPERGNHPSTDPLTSGWTRSAAAVHRGHSAVSEGLTPAPRLGRAWATSRPATAPRLACSPCANALRGSTVDLGGRAGGSTSHQVGARAPPSLLALRTVSAAGADGAKSPPGKCGAAVGPRLGAETALPSFQ